MNILLLRLEGLLQSWGEHSRWNHRDSTDMPTKSGVIGLIGCAMGLPRGDIRLKELADGLKMAVRADRMGSIMTDYHTIQGHTMNPLNAIGGERTENTIVSHREYMQDACYTIFLAGDATVLTACKEALLHPVWVPSLGRRSCPPTRPLQPIMTEEYASLEEAVQNHWWTMPPVANMNDQMRIEIEDPSGEKERNDQPVNSSVYAYRKRKVKVCYVKKGDELVCS